MKEGGLHLWEHWGQWTRSIAGLGEWSTSVLVGRARAAPGGEVT